MNRIDILHGCYNRPSQVGTLTRYRYAPNQIAEILGVSEGSIHQYIDRAACEGLVNYVQVYLALNGVAVPVQELFVQHVDLPIVSEPIVSKAKRKKYERFAVAEHYLQIREIERKLHESIKLALIELFGEEENGWWRQGIPKDVRTSCVSMRENDSSGAIYEPFAYTNFADLEKILRCNRKNNQASFDVIAGLSNADVDAFLKDLLKLNQMRNTVMHPVRIEFPDDDQLLFVQELHKKLIP